MLRIEFKTGAVGFAYEDGTTATGAVADVLRSIAYKLEDDRTEGVIYDPNGNRVGEWSYTEDSNDSDD